MRKNILLIIALMLGITAMQANPVNIDRAERLGRNFIQHNAQFAKNATQDFILVHTCFAQNGLATAYVFNFNGGFVIVSADDSYSPILGYSNSGNFDYETAPDGMLFMLGELSNDIERTVAAGVQTSNDIACRWKNLEKFGKMHPDKGTPIVGPLLGDLKWNQDFPYNMYAPGGCPTGCVATAMAQLMKYWEWPVQGTGEHCYIAEGYGQQCANFGETTYQWDQMIDNYATTSGSTEAQKVAVATLMYHCGVSVNMMYGPDGSGAYSVDVPDAINNYFSYSDSAVHISKNEYDYDGWIALLKSNIDQQIPIYYSGQSSEGGHAFICDGYDNEDLFHFNWGWGGAANNYFLIDGENFDYTGYQAIVYDFVPDYIYNEMPQASSNLSVTIDSDVSRVGHLSWTNPTLTMAGNEITTLSKVIVKRNGIIVHEIENVAPGQEMTYDDEVPYFDKFEYDVIAVNGESYGRAAQTYGLFGPYCEWTVVMTSASFQGWEGGGITVQNAAGTYIDFLTTTTSMASLQHFQMALGNNNLYWTAPNSNVSNLSFKIKDAENQIVYQYEGPSTDLEAGLLRTINNSCGHENVCEAPYNLKVTLDPDNDRNIVLTWESDHEPEFGYCIYRDGFLFNMSHETNYVDKGAEIGGYCYYITALCEGGETVPSNEYCATAGTGCESPLDLHFSYMTNNKVRIDWTAPDNENITGYYVYRKTDDTPYKRIKSVRDTYYKDNSSMMNTNYQYAVVAYYENINCASAYAADLYDKNKFYVYVDWSNTPTAFQAELVENEEESYVTMMWRPAFKATSYDIMRNGVKIGETTTETEFVDYELEAGETYCYKVVAHGEDFETSSEEACVETPEPPVLPCSAPTNLLGDFRPALGFSNAIHVEWQAPEDRVPDSYTLFIYNMISNDTTILTNLTETVYESVYAIDGTDKIFQVKAVYPECESEFALTADGNDFVRLTSLSVGENTVVAKPYPNPASSQVTVEVDGMTSVSVYDLIGQCVMETVVKEDNMTLDLSALQPGVYLVKVSTPRGSVMEKVVKM